jgi:DnaJ-class molecular chaperone
MTEYGKFCTRCGGTGETPYPLPWTPYYEEIETCDLCNGDRVVEYCPDCAGEGYNNCSVDSERFLCKTCNGRGK